MNKYGMMMVCGNSIEELEQNLAMLKMAVASGAMMGCGGATLADVEKGVAALGGNLPHNYPSEHLDRYCDCGCGCCHNEDEEIDPINEAYENLIDHLRSMGLCTPTVHRLLEELADRL